MHAKPDLRVLFSACRSIGHYKPSEENLEIVIKKFKEAGIEFPEDENE